MTGQIHGTIPAPFRNRSGAAPSSRAQGGRDKEGIGRGVDWSKCSVASASSKAKVTYLAARDLGLGS